MYWVATLLVWFVLCEANQLNFTRECSFSPTPDHRHCSSNISVWAEQDNISDPTGALRVALFFTVPEDRGTPCLDGDCSKVGPLAEGCHNHFFDYGPQTYAVLLPKSTFEEEGGSCTVLISGQNCPQEKCVLSVNSSILFTPAPITTIITSQTAEVTEVSTATMLVPESSTSASNLSIDKPSHYPPFYVIGILAALIVLLIFAGFLYNRHRIRTKAQAKFYETDIFPTLSFTIYIVFLDEHPKHRDVVLKFASYLKERFHFDILLELYDRKRIYDNPAAWLEGSLSSCDLVLVIWSPGAEERWKNQDNFTDRLDLFTPVIKQIKEDSIFKRNLRKYVFAYFDYCTEIPKSIKANNIPSVNLMKDFYTLCKTIITVAKSKKICDQYTKVFINEGTEKNVPEVAVNLQRSISEMCSYVQGNKTWSHLKPISSSEPLSGSLSHVV